LNLVRKLEDLGFRLVFECLVFLAMLTALLFLIVKINAITEQQLEYLKNWRLCPQTLTFNGQCQFQCSTECRDNEVIKLLFDNSDWTALNETQRENFQYFPEVEEIFIFGGIPPIELYSQLAYFTKLREITSRSTVTGTFPNELAQLRHFSHLVINSQLSGTLPIELQYRNITHFELQGENGRLYGPIPNFTNASACILTSGTIGDPVSNPGLFCECYGPCRERIYDGRRRNRCSETCGTQRSGRCAKEIATLGHGYVCVDSCDRCPTECMPNIDNSAYICPGDPTLPPSPPPLSTSDWIIIDLDDDDDYKSDYARSLKLF
jgi:hypothetical protein